MAKKRSRKSKVQHSKRHRREHRALLRALDRYAARTGFVVVLVRHLNAPAGGPAGAGAEPTLEAGPVRRPPVGASGVRSGRRRVVPGVTGLR